MRTLRSPVSSATSRSATPFGVSPRSIVPLGSIHLPVSCWRSRMRTSPAGASGTRTNTTPPALRARFILRCDSRAILLPARPRRAARGSGEARIAVAWERSGRLVALVAPGGAPAALLAGLLVVLVPLRVGEDTGPLHLAL